MKCDTIRYEKESSCESKKKLLQSFAFKYAHCILCIVFDIDKLQKLITKISTLIV